MYQIGKYNVDNAGEIIDNIKHIRYQLVIISKFDGNNEVGRKSYYFHTSTPLPRTNNEVAKIFEQVKHSKVSWNNSQYHFS